MNWHIKKRGGNVMPGAAKTWQLGKITVRIQINSKLFLNHTQPNNHSMLQNVFGFTSVLHFLLFFPMLAITEAKKGLFLLDAIFSGRLHLGQYCCMNYGYHTQKISLHAGKSDWLFWGFLFCFCSQKRSNFDIAVLSRIL